MSLPESLYTAAVRAAAVDRDSDLLRPIRAAAPLVLVAGSTWPADEERLIPAIAALPRTGWRLVLTPHEPTDEHLRSSEALVAAHGLRARRLSALGGSPPEEEVILVDRVGVLGDLYAVADLAYVGGGWGSAGLHSVLEPAAYGLPVLFGPRHRNAREAAELIDRGAAFAPPDAAALRERLLTLTSDAGARSVAGAASLAYIGAGVGAAARGAGVVEELM
jgi:3-deoxy-D-manno-octulosonic-acid transferase